MPSTNYGIVKYGLPAERSRGLVFAERFENDTTVSENSGTVSGTVTFDDNKVTFGGTTSDKITYDNPFINGQPDVFVFQFKFKRGSSSNEGLFYDDSSFPQVLVLNNKILLSLSGDEYLYSSSEINTTDEYSIAIVSDGTSNGSNIYINGVLSNGSKATGTPNEWTGLVLGRGDGLGFSGYLKDLNIFNKELTAQEVLDYFNDNVFSYDKEWTSGQKLLDGDMEASGTSDWTSFTRSTGSKDTTTFHSGTQSLKITRDDPTFSSSTFYARQDCIKTGRTYKVTGWYKTDGVVDYAFVGTTISSDIKLSNTTEWTYFEGFIYNSPRDYFVLSAVMNTNTDGVQIWFDDVTVREYKGGAELILPMDLKNHDPTNVRTLDVSGKGNHATFGDGTTSTTYPTKLMDRKGYNLDGGDYFKGNTITKLNNTPTMTLMACVKFDNDYSNPSVYDILISGNDTWEADEPWALFLNGDNLRFEIKQVASSSIAKIIKGQTATYGITYNAGTVNYYVNGEIVDTKITTETTTGSKQNGYYIGGSEANRYIKGSGETFFASADCLTPLQMIDLHYKMLQEVNRK